METLRRTNMNKLRGKISERGFSLGAFAQSIGMSYATFHRKMKRDGIAFTIDEVHKMADVLHLSASDERDIFLLENSQICE